MLWNWIQNGLLKSCLTLTQEWNDSWIPISPSGIFDDAWDPNISCTQKIKPNILKLCFSHTDSASQITHFTHPTKFYCLSFSCSWRLWAQKALSSGKKTLSREERSQAFHGHSHVSAVNLISVRNKNYLRIPQDQEQFQSFFGECQVCVFSLLSPEGTWGDWSNKKQGEAHKKHASSLATLSHSKQRKKQNSQGRYCRT